MLKMVNNYAANKTKLVSYCRMNMKPVIMFSFLLCLSMIGELGVATGSLISTPQIEGQELE
jgi:hypothetical protein